MTDPVPSGDSAAPAAPSAPAANAATDASAAAQQSETPSGGFGAFGSTRGSGLARGKRSTTPAASAAAHPAPKGEYQPTAVEVITPQREYENPFGGETSVAAPVAAIPEAPIPAAPVRPIEAPAPVEARPSASAPAAAPQDQDLFPFSDKEKGEAKPELKILPPQEVRREPMSWEHREERPIFKPGAERRSDDRASGSAPAGSAGGYVEPARPGSAGPEGEFRGERGDRFRSGRGERRGRSFDRDGPRGGRERSPGSESGPGTPEDRPENPAGREERPFDSRRGERPGFERREREGYRGGESRSEPAAPRPRGFIAWLKSLFAPDKPEAPSEQRGSQERHDRGDRGEQGHGGHRRRHRGGQGRHRGDFRGGPQGERREGGEFRGEHRGGDSAPAEDRSGGSGEHHPGGEGRPDGENRGDFGGQRRRRHRGGRGRHRGDRGGGGGDRGPRPEGQQGGGYI